MEARRDGGRAGACTREEFNGNGHVPGATATQSAIELLLAAENTGIFTVASVEFRDCVSGGD